MKHVPSVTHALLLKQVFLVKDGESVPTLTAMINMPASEALL